MRGITFDALLVEKKENETTKQITTAWSFDSKIIFLDYFFLFSFDQKSTKTALLLIYDQQKSVLLYFI